jgi:plastocyanin
VKTPILSRSIIVARCIPIAVVVALAASGCGSSNSTSPTGTSTTGSCTPTATNPECVNPANLLTVTIKSGVYSPNPVAVKVGQSVNWLNSDTIAHTATDAGVFDTGSIAPTSAADVPVPFNTPGTYTYHCTLHANETATIVVTQ